MAVSPELAPVVDEAILGPRPSDASSARAWIGSPAVDTTPCCDVSEIVALGDEPRHVSMPVITWNGESFGAVWSVLGEPGEAFCPHAIYQELDTNAQPVTPEHLLQGLHEPAAIAWADGRYLLAAGAGGPANYLLIFDRAATITELTMPADLVTAVARSASAHAWIIATHAYALDEWSPSGLSTLDDRLAVTRTVPLEPVASASALRLAVIGTLVVVQGERRRGTELDVFEGPTLTPMGRVTGSAAGGWLVASRDVSMTAGIASGAVHTLASDPFAMTERGARDVASPAPERSLVRDGAMAADDHGGTTAICWIESPAHGDDVLRVMLTDADGRGIGTPIEIAGGPTAPEPSTCALASNGADDYLLMFTSEAPGGDSLFAASLHVRR